MHTHPHHQVSSIFPQVNPRTSERNRALERSGERSWFPLHSQPPPTAAAGAAPRPAIAAAVILGVAPPGALLALQRGRTLAGAGCITPSKLPQLVRPPSHSAAARDRGAACNPPVPAWRIHRRPGRRDGESRERARSRRSVRRGYGHAMEASFVRAELASRAPHSQSPCALMPPSVRSVVPKIGCARVWRQRVRRSGCGVRAVWSSRHRRGRGCTHREDQSAVTAAIALISRSAPGTARPVTRAAVTSGGAPARARRGAIAP
jgi:hypothetical protein